ncbi:MAG: hypothetical protein BAA01_00155 [Bacillus thermozeamaize]|uniref:Uncharacterized protein n=1 Tax=Bacillus thermozeamaize TaxID=230954 RepID=A0A1Y3PD23_9BACI|nr:MAG: hypothetical protein BAA01_00155 [Bacillus thermozeamaize]
MDLKRILSEIHAKAIVGQKDPEKAQAKCGEIVDMIERVFWIPQHEVSEAMAFGLDCRDSRCYF